MELTINFENWPELYHKLNEMIRGLPTIATPTQPSDPVPTAKATENIVPQLQPAMQASVAPDQRPVTVFPGMPVTPTQATVPAAPAAMPTTYTPEQINAACTPLIDAGRYGELKQIISEQFGVSGISVMTAEQLAQFVTIIRGMGALI